MPANTPSLPNFDRQLFSPGQRIVAAVSGGADSIALLRALHQRNTADREALGIGLAIAHVHHGIRGAAADADLEFVRTLAHQFDLHLHVHHADAPTHAEKNSLTLEEAARNLRYDFFRSLIASGEADAICTAHTLDDQAETVLMKLVRGAWTEGLSGIHPILNIAPRGKILRPMLNIRRAEIEAYLNALQQPWREDATNADPAHTRNRARAEWLPLLRRENPRIDESLARLALLARDEESRWQSELARLLPSILLPGSPVRGGGRAVSGATISIDLSRLRTMDPSLRRRVLRAAAQRLGHSLGFTATAQLLALCGFPEPIALDLPPIRPETGSKIHLPNGLVALRTARELRLLVEENKPLEQ